MKNTSGHPYFWLSVALAAVLLAAAGGLYHFYTMSEELNAQKTSLEAIQKELTLALASTTNRLSERQAELLQTQDDLEDTESDLRREKRKNDEFEEEFRETIDTIRDLDKLAKIDEELLQKYSKVSFLNENYLPTSLVQIDDEWVLPGKKDQYFLRDAWPFLEDMLEEAEDDDIDLRVISAYRSFDEQNEIKGQFTTLYGEGANAFSADQGFSEHQLGTTVDLTDPETGATSVTFKDTEAYEWLQDNAHKFGFILSYPEGNQFYIFEPWHWRFVGVDLARDLERANDNFYDWEQRDIDEYLIKIFD